MTTVSVRQRPTPMRVLTTVLFLVAVGLIFWFERYEQQGTGKPATDAVQKDGSPESEIEHPPNSRWSNNPTGEGRPSTESSSTTSPSDSGSNKRLSKGSATFQSPGGLLYGKGSADGTRFRHVLQHQTDNPDKPQHGVFDGSEEEILSLIDDVWKKYERGDPAVRHSMQDQRIVLTGRFDHRIGYLGGSDGKRRGHPECRYLRVVVDPPNRIVTAYPVVSE